MRIRNITLLLCLSVSSLLMTTEAATTITPYSAFTYWLPVVGIAALAAASIAVIYYMIGVVLNDRKVKARASQEIVQAVGTAIIAIVIISFLIFFWNLISSSIISSTLPISAASMSTICDNYLEKSGLDLINWEPTYGSNSICSLIKGASLASADPTTNLDYGIAATYVIYANLTNQAANNLNGLYLYENYIGFLSSLTSVTTFCEAEGWCAIPVEPRTFQVSVAFAPFAGFSFISQITKPMEAQAVFVFYLFFVELLAILLMLYLWPYMLAAGIILRSFSITRGTGGLLMAMAIGAIVILPFVVLIEYSVLGGGTGTPSTPLIGFNTLTMTSGSFLIYGNTITGGGPVYNSLKPNFFVFPDVSDIASHHGCFPGFSGLLGYEIGDSLKMALFGITAVLSYASGFASSLPVISYSCTPKQAMATAIDLTNVYGLISITGFILPILNLIAIISGVRNLSYLIGGETELWGIGRFL